MFLFLIRLLKFYKFKAYITFKSGKVIGIRCDSFDITLKGNEITAYEIKNVDPNAASYINISEIASIRVRPTFFGKF